MTKKKKRVLLFSVIIVSVLSAAFFLIRHLFSVKSADPFFPAEKNVTEFGSYPQTRVTDDTLIAALNQQPLEWKSYGYYIGNDDFGSAKQSDYMQYADVSLHGTTYRAVRFSAYRPYCCHKTSLFSWQQRYYDLELNTVYWFRYEPIRWIVLSEKERFLLSEKILDAQPVNSIVYVKDAERDAVLPDCYKDPDFSTYATDYYTSDMRAWLNGTFLNTAFSDMQAAQIQATALDNSAWNPRYARFDSKNSCDKVFLLSYNEATNPEYGFSEQSEKTDDLRTSYPTDYALCQGIWTVGGVYKKGASWWWLRTGGIMSAYPCGVTFYGSVVFTLVNAYSPDCVDTGVRPAIRLITNES